LVQSLQAKKIHSDQMTQILKGIHSDETLKCGCEIIRYTGGKVLLNATHICTDTPRHRTCIKHICGKCGLVTSKKKLKIHKHEQHAI